MNLYYVCQNQTYKHESTGQYLWSHQRTKNGNKNKGYTNMSNVKEGDIIFHGAKQATYAISIAKTDCLEDKRPDVEGIEYKGEKEKKDGYLVWSKYIILDTPLNMKDEAKWFLEHPKEDTPIAKNGTLKEIYLNKIDIELATYLLKRIIETQNSNELKNKIDAILHEICFEIDPEYEEEEINIINQEINTLDSTENFSWSGVREEQKLQISSGTGRTQHKRNPIKAAKALAIANYKCEYEENDRIFLRKNGKGYTEPHHLIPISKYKDFNYSLDVEENIVSLCSHCHNLLHYGRLEDKIIILKKLYTARRAPLLRVGLELKDFADLLKYYK